MLLFFTIKLAVKENAILLVLLNVQIKNIFIQNVLLHDIFYLLISIIHHASRDIFLSLIRKYIT